MNYVELLVSLQWNKNHDSVKNSKSLLFKQEALYVYYLNSITSSIFIYIINKIIQLIILFYKKV